MSHPAYRISINKSVDRYLFIDFIRFAYAHNFIDIQKAKYYSLGGPFLIDLKLIHSFYPFLQLTSIEEDRNTFLRQESHKFCKNVNLVNQTSSDFIGDADFDKQTIFWLDYTKLSREHLDDIAKLAYKLPMGSIIKMTFNVGRPYKPSDLDKAGFDQNQAVLDFRSKYSAFLPAAPLDFKTISEQARFETLAYTMVKNAVSSLLKERKDTVHFEFCDSVVYADTCPMMSLTGMLLSVADCDKIRANLTEDSRFSPTVPQEINMPDLSVLERHRINQKMPSQDAAELLNALGYPLERGEVSPCKKSLEMLLLYSKFWHKYPEFVRVNL